MKIIFLGVGEAFDENLANSSILIESSSNILLDCGYSAMQNLFKYSDDPEFLDAIFISHSHADHYFGIVPLLVRLKEDNRKKPLNIFCGEGNKKKIEELLELGYSGAINKLSYELEIIEVNSLSKNELGKFRLSFAQSKHPIVNYAIRIDEEGKSFCYSGDGKATTETKRLFEGAELVAHECYLFSGDHENHGTLESLKKIFEESKIKRLACIHINRKEREKTSQLKNHQNIIFPEEMDEIII